VDSAYTGISGTAQLLREKVRHVGRLKDSLYVLGV
jgi:hypothetical protein